MYDQDGEDDWILGQTTGLLAQRGDEQAVSLLVDVQSVTIASTSEVARSERVFLPDIEGGVWGTETIYLREAVLDVDDHLVLRFTEEVCQRIAGTLTYVAERNGVENVAYVRARPALPEVGGDWRAAYAARLASDRPSNQGRRESGGGHPAEDGLRSAAPRSCGSTGRLRACRTVSRRRGPSRSRRYLVSACVQATPGSPTSWSWAAAVS